jgi:dTDP-4-dehydrorhamnose 3,5-epimerase
MKVNKKFKIKGLIEFQPTVFKDSRGQFIETYNEDVFREHGFNYHFKQDNQSISKRGSFRGIHLQLDPWAQGKLVRVSKGSVIDYAVDLRPGSPTFGQWESIELSAEKGNQFWVPAGFGHAFVALEDDTIFCYKCTEVYAPKHQVGIRWDDKDIDLDIPIPSDELEVSEKDQAALYLSEYVREYVNQATMMG